jgi:2-polyprenyl-3-methyl-5-hydroxy-6-metoxy-1,4-benzoquinol methylase
MMYPVESDNPTARGRQTAEKLDTHYSERLVEALRPCKPGKWLQDELSRADKILTREAVVLSRYLDIRDKRLLDFGCGAGASSVAWSRLGAIVTGIEPDEHLAAAAQIRVAEDAVEDSVHILHLPDTRHLPFAAGSFQVCVCNAVLEHIPPPDRGQYIREVWRVLEPGGCLYITETPNRLSPYDGHTTQLWWVPWMPVPLARRYGIWRGRIEPDKSEAELLTMGIRGASYFEIASALRCHPFAIVRSRGKDEVEGTVDLERPQSALRRGLKSAYVGLFRLLDHTVCRWSGVPIAAFLPDLTLCLQKLPIPAENDA